MSALLQDYLPLVIFIAVALGLGAALLIAPFLVAYKQPDPEKDAKVYGADLTGTFLSLFPVTDCCVLQSHLTMIDEPNYKLELNAAVIPKEGTAVKLILVAE